MASAVTMKDLKSMKEDLKCGNLKCECGAPPETVYFTQEPFKLICAICDSCRNVYESMIRGIGRSFCSDPGCQQCESSEQV